MGTDSKKRRIKSVHRACRLLIYLRKEGPSTVSGLASEFDLSPGTVHTYLATLREAGFVEQRDGAYGLSFELLPLGERVRSQNPIYQVARDEVDRLAHASNGVAHLLIEYEGQLLVLYEVFGEKAIGKDYHAAKRDQPQEHIHCTAGGKAILARLPPERVEEIIADHGLPSFTAQTISDPDELLDELEAVQEGLSVEEGVLVEGCCPTARPPRAGSRPAT
jgi:DNA-binding IclR family transcriptional regulator